jgi:hypothetical protein
VSLIYIICFSIPLSNPYYCLIQKHEKTKKMTAKKMVITIGSLFLFYTSSLGQCTPNYIPGSLILNPSKTYYCIGDNIQVSFNFSQPVWNEYWDFSGTAAQTTTLANTMNITNIKTAGVVTFTAFYQSGNFDCPFSTNITINMSYVNVTATSPVAIIAMFASNIGCTPGNGFTPYTYNWQPNNFFSNGTSNTNQNPIITSPTSLVYTVTVTDNVGCVATTTVEVIAPPYAHLAKMPDGGYYTLISNKLLFKYEGQYATSAITYNVYDKNNTVVASNISGSLLGPATTVKSGDNRYYIDASGFATGYYTLELINEKNEKEYLRFKK